MQVKTSAGLTDKIPVGDLGQPLIFTERKLTFCHGYG